jgi:uroporphyrinogen decarboxylase
MLTKEEIFIMEKMSSKQRMLAAIERKKPDRLPVTTHHVMKYFLDKYMGGISSYGFFEHFGLDPIVWTVPLTPNGKKGEYHENGNIMSDNWRIVSQPIDNEKYVTVRRSIITPKGTLTTVLQSNEYTTWVSEHLIKQKSDIEMISDYVTHPLCDKAAVEAEVDSYGDKALIRGHIPGFDFFGQPGCWQDAACLVGIEKLILLTYDDPAWVNELLEILRQRKLSFIRSLKGVRYDLLELGGGDASSTVISPDIFDAFVAPFDSELISEAHKSGQKIVYHTCGGMMPLLENIASMAPDAMETFTPPAMGGDTDLAEAKRRIGDKVCMIGGFDQHNFFTNCSPDETRKEVRRCFEAAGQNGGFILSPSDHFFDADPELIAAYTDEAKTCN